MATVTDDTIGGFNTFLKEQPEDVMIHLTLFDHEITHMYTKPAKEADALTKDTFIPRGSTALLDAIGHTIKSVPDGEVPTVMILTDGFENASRKYNKMHINDLISEKKKQGWIFVFLAANQDAIKTGGDLGIDGETSLTFDTANVGTAFRSASCAINRCRAGETLGVQFSQTERLQSSQTPI
jgi:hypothetical protein